MSIETCAKCGEQIDTDFRAEEITTGPMGEPLCLYCADHAYSDYRDELGDFEFHLEADG